MDHTEPFSRDLMFSPLQERRIFAYDYTDIFSLTQSHGSLLSYSGDSHKLKKGSKLFHSRNCILYLLRLFFLFLGVFLFLEKKCFKYLQKFHLFIEAPSFQNLSATAAKSNSDSMRGIFFFIYNLCPNHLYFLTNQL